VSNSTPPSDVASLDLLVNYITVTRDQGASDGIIRQLLRSHGWSETAVDSAFAEFYQRLTGQPVPTPSRYTGGSARDAALYLLAFITLGIWSQALGEIGFIIVDQVLPNPTSPEYYGGNYGYQLSAGIARLIVVFPIYLLIMRLLNQDLAKHPGKSESGVRRWLTYLALLIMALTMIINIFLFLTSLLAGDLTLRFVAKTLIVLLIVGCILWYYLTWLQQEPEGS